ncbi:MAG: cobyrinate a,c-diamide synthase [Parahaliea sp.]
MLTTPGLLISAPASGAGKTTVTLGLLGALRNRGLSVQAFKCGPDYIDAAFHRRASGRDSFNLDSWAMSRTQLAGIIHQAAGADLAIAEGAMGLFDGALDKGIAGNGAAADIAILTGWPVILVIDVSGQAQSAAAVALGFKNMCTDMKLAGVIFNRVGSPQHEAMLRTSMEGVAINVLGAIPRSEKIHLPERHLGLVPAQETADLDGYLLAASHCLEQHCDLEAILKLARSNMLMVNVISRAATGRRIALARDAAFAFIYPHLLAAWRAAGADILPFSPLADEAPDPRADICWLPGGYPELHAEKLASAVNFMAGLREFALTRPVHGECGGYMVLGESLIDRQGRLHKMAGLLELVSSYHEPRLHVGYRRARLLAPIPGFEAGMQLYGHEFHYSSTVSQTDPPLARIYDASGNSVAETGAWRGYVSGSYFHLLSPDQT